MCHYGNEQKSTVRYAIIAIAFTSIALCGCDQLFPPKKKARAKPTPEQMANSPAQSVTREINGNQIVSIQLPVIKYGAMVEVQHCIVWRDREFKTASLSCPGGTDIDLSSDAP